MLSQPCCAETLATAGVKDDVEVDAGFEDVGDVRVGSPETDVAGASLSA